MNKKKLEEHKEYAKKLEWCELSKLIITIEIELTKKKPELPRNTLSKLLKIYESEKKLRVKEQSSNLTYGNLLYGTDFYASWDEVF